MYETEYIEFLPLVNLYDFCCEMIVTCEYALLGHFPRVDECLCPIKIFRFSKSNLSFGFESKKPIKKLLVSKGQNFYVKLLVY